MIPKRLFLWSGLLLLSLAGLTLAWLYWPVSQVERVLDFSPQQMLPSAGVEPLLGPRRMHLTFPAWVRLGDQASIRLTFSPLPGESVTPAQNPYTIYAETHLDMPKLNPDPSGVAGQVLPPAQAVTFWWQLHPDRAGLAEGTAWLSLRFEPLDGGEPLVNAVAAPRLSIPVRGFLGMSVTAVRWLGGLSALCGLLALFRFILPDLTTRAFKKRAR